MEGRKIFFRSIKKLLSGLMGVLQMLYSFWIFKKIKSVIREKNQGGE